MSDEPPPITWPEIGEFYTDDTGRKLVITRVKIDKLGRHIVGSVNGKDYSCDIATFLLIWQARKGELV